MSEPTILGRWYAEPLSADEARQCFAEASRRLEQRLRHGGRTLCCRLHLMMARFWQGEDISEEYRNLQRLAAGRAHSRALLELIYGQLLLSRQLTGALEHLDYGFNLARNLFTAGDYFTVMNRHRLLRQLPLSDTPAEAKPLESLLTSARVIERMRQSAPARPNYPHDPKDTYG